MRPSTNSFKRLLNEFRELRRFQRLKPCDRDIVFYAESESYFIYFEPFIKHLIQDHNRKICYVTSSSSDPILQNKSEEIRTFCIGEKSIRTIFFASLNVNILVMTLLDLNRFHIKRSKYPVHYVFVPHSIVSTHMAFRKGAHNDFDTIFCVGPHHVTELREAEEKYDLTPRTLVENGYARVDTIYDESKAMKLRSSPTGNSPLRILIAPSWGKNCILELAGEDLVKVLLDSDYHVTVRPHRHTRRFSGPLLDKLRDKYSSNPGFVWEEGIPSHDSFHQSDILITDWSGSAFSFSFALERPVLFIDTPRKINNPEYELFKAKPLEVTIREHIGSVLSLDEIDQAANAVEMLLLNETAYSKKIQNLRNRWVFNFGNSAKKGADYLVDLSNSLRV